MNRIIGLDYGEKRIGLAISDPFNMTAQPLLYLPNDGKLLDALQEKIDEYTVNECVVGLPKNREGGDSLKAKEVRDFAETLSAELSLTIIFWDERFSTVAVTKHLIAADVSRKKRKKKG